MKLKNILTIILFVLFLVALGGNYYLYNKYKSALNMLNNPEQLAQSELNKILEQLKQLMELPTDEEPTLATVLDKETLKEQPFFSKAENGDKVVIYTKNSKAILFRPSQNKIIEVAPISIVDTKEQLDMTEGLNTQEQTNTNTEQNNNNTEQQVTE